MVQNDFLCQLDLNTYDFAVIQEPYLDRNHNTCTTHHWYTIYPKEHCITLSWCRAVLLYALEKLGSL